MSSEEFSTVRRCPRCGAEIRLVGAREICSCHEETSIRAGTPEQAARDRELVKRIKLPGLHTDPVGMGVYGALGILICAGLAYLAPGLLIVVLVLAVPAMIRTVVHSVGRKTPLTWLDKIGVFLSTLGIIAIVSLAAVAAFLATCFFVVVGGMSLGVLADYILWLGVAMGLLAGLAAGVLMVRNFWRRFK